MGSGALHLDDMLGNILEERFGRWMFDWTFVNCGRNLMSREVLPVTFLIRSCKSGRWENAI